MAFAAAGFGTVHYQCSGQSRGLPIVFCNSLGTDTHIWDGVVVDLSPDYRLVTYDKRGHGLTSVPRGPYSIEDRYRRPLRATSGHFVEPEPV